MPTSRGIGIGVLSNQVLLNEYAVQSGDEKTVSCFIASEPDKTFEMILTNDLEGQDVSISIHVDGTFIGRFFLSQGQKVLPGVYVSETVTKPFRFRDLNVKDDRELHDPRCYTWDNIGTLDFNIYRCQKTGTERFRTQIPETMSGKADTSRDRTSSPGSPDGILTGNEVKMKAVHGVGGVTIDPPDQPYARIFFRYRPRDILVLQGVISSSTPTTSSTSTAALPSLSRSSSATAVTAASSSSSIHPGNTSNRKRSLDSVSLSLPDLSSRPSQKARLAPPSAPTGARVTTIARPRSGTSSTTDGALSMGANGTWGVPPSTEGVASGMAEELHLMKAQLRTATEQMDIAMSQMRNSMEQMYRCMSQMQFLQQRIDAFETRGGAFVPPLAYPTQNQSPTHSNQVQVQGLPIPALTAPATASAAVAAHSASYAHYSEHIAGTNTYRNDSRSSAGGALSPITDIPWTSGTTASNVTYNTGDSPVLQWPTST